MLMRKAIVAYMCHHPLVCQGRRPRKCICLVMTSLKAICSFRVPVSRLKPKIQQKLKNLTVSLIKDPVKNLQKRILRKDSKKHLSTQKNS